MIAAHVFMGAGYYPRSGLGDYKASFYGEDAIDGAEIYVSLMYPESRDDWYAIVVDRGEGLETYREHWGREDS